MDFFRDRDIEEMNDSNVDCDTEDEDIGIDLVNECVTNHMPQCDDNLKPRIGQSFKSLDDGIQFYKNYALACGFDIRLSSATKARDGTIVWRYIVCNREGEKQVEDVDSDKIGDEPKAKRCRVSRRFNCMARIALKYTSSVGYVVMKFIEVHTHTLVPDAYKHFMKMNRKLDSCHQQYILNCARANIGPVKSYRLFKETVGGYSRVGCKATDFKNFSRDLHAFAIGKDAQMLIDKLFNRRELCSAFFFDYHVDENQKLKRLFWADPISIRNYHAFGDVIAFDATYEMNKYNMVFAPFTGKDNHGKSVTFGAGLLSNEDILSYSWLFEKFLLCMGRAPRMLITDQDPAMKIAIEKIFPETRHRLCMWHIMKKVKEKIPQDLKNDPLFWDEMNDNVWSPTIEPEEFEHRWSEFINSFGLSNHKWFSSMYEIRYYWIPAYFRDFPLSGMLRTTSICESANSFFGKYLDKHDDLVEFFMHFESAMDSQRHKHDSLCSDDQTTSPLMETKLSIEKHAASIFTAKVFKTIQMSIDKGCHRSPTSSISVDQNKSVYIIHGFAVTYDSVEKSVVCSCKKFVIYGFICSHMFAVFQNLEYTRIPDQYILRRWSKNAFDVPIEDLRGDASNAAAAMDMNQISMNQVYSQLHSITGLVKGNQNKIYALHGILRRFKDELLHDEDAPNTVDTNEQLFQDFYGSSMPEKVSIFVPDLVKTKGSGNRMESIRDKAVREMQKALRKCRKCGQMARHDSRNCPNQIGS